ncbi:dimethylamine monooxygenase subunit DmmA family protein [Gordonia sp. ABSL1-1]|uniref:dimethylamine monooxygenase subunit DmmA family protein n=1 Tax=Gordonia sp. ABSL1-1 TaxID=3053923 RepID=UPI0025725048|nr:dimethylamine monooxygenase subunit DmmA family protein [Gordonia sp. ABSL1-1]MDL9935358.1 dimethylamine monooxygenase subunit DmmA family protein [Gordonia sp. ABSL1-1]
MTAVINGAEAGPESQIPYSSIPEWARPEAMAAARGVPLTPDPTGAAYVLVGIGESGRARVRAWSSTIGAAAAVTELVAHPDDIDSVAIELRKIVLDGVVGLRVMLTGPSGACLRLRATAIGAGVEDDELAVDPVDDGNIDVFCAHCRTINRLAARVDDVVTCAGCARNLVVYHHVSRRTGSYLGFMSDAETAGPAPTEKEEAT